MMFNKVKNIFLTTGLLLLCNSKLAFAGEGSTSQNASSTINTSNSEVSTTVTSNSSLSTTPVVGAQTGVIQFNNSGLSALSYPSCEGACIFAITEIIPSNNGNASVAAVAGVIWQLTSPSKTQADANKLIAIAQSDNISQETTVSLAEKLIEAIDSGNNARINLLAIILSKRLGYSDFSQLLKEIKEHKSI